MEIEIDKGWKFGIYVFFQLFFAIAVLILVCIVGYYVLFSQNVAYKQMSDICDKQFGEGNWTIQDTIIRTHWYSIGQEFTCVSNQTGKYLNEVLKEEKK